MNHIEGKTTSELLALTQVVEELVAGGVVERADHADGIHYYMYMPMGSKTFEVSIDVTDANTPLPEPPGVVATAVVSETGDLYGIEESELRGRIGRGIDQLINAKDEIDKVTMIEGTALWHARNSIIAAAQALRGQRG